MAKYSSQEYKLSKITFVDLYNSFIFGMLKTAIAAMPC